MQHIYYLEARKTAYLLWSVKLEIVMYKFCNYSMALGGSVEINAEKNIYVGDLDRFSGEWLSTRCRCPPDSDYLRKSRMEIGDPPL